MSDERTADSPDGRCDDAASPAKRKMVIFGKNVTSQEIADALNAMMKESENDDA